MAEPPDLSPLVSDNGHVGSAIWTRLRRRSLVTGALYLTLSLVVIVIVATGHHQVAARIPLILFAVLLAYLGLGRMAFIHNRDRELARSFLEVAGMPGIKIERGTSDKPGLTLADVEAWIEEARRAGAPDNVVVHASSFLRGDGVMRLWVNLARDPATPDDGPVA